MYWKMITRSFAAAVAFTSLVFVSPSEGSASQGKPDSRFVATVRFVDNYTDGCTRMNAYVNGVKRKGKLSDGTMYEQDYYWVYVQLTDICTGFHFLGGSSGLLEPGVFERHGMGSASLTGVVRVHNWYTDDYYDVMIDLEWKGVGKVTVENNEIYQSQRRSRESEIDGTVMLWDVDFAAAQHRQTLFYEDLYR